jgi:hypothetical protein
VTVSDRKMAALVALVVEASGAGTLEFRSYREGSKAYGCPADH